MISKFNETEVSMIENKEKIVVNSGKSWDESLEKESWVAPLADIFETADEYFLVANMPGSSKDNIKIKLEEGCLIIMGRINYDVVKKRKYVLKETEFGNYYRKFNIAESIDDGKIDATFENGQLIVKLPKHERIKPKTIPIQ
jgi:HSP20 family protein